MIYIYIFTFSSHVNSSLPLSFPPSLQLAENAGMKPIEIVTELRRMHAVEGVKGAGINVVKGVVSDMYDLNVLQPLLVSTSAINLATETCALILKIDDLVVVM